MVLGYDPSSDFQVEINKNVPKLVRQFFIGDSDYSQYVTKWPRFEQRINDPRAKNLVINLANEDGTFNFFESDKTKLRNTVSVRFGVNFGAVGSEELLTMFQGTGERTRFRRGALDYTVVDKWTQLSEIEVGASDSPIVVSDSLVSDVVWWLTTCYGGYSNIESTSNPDIDWEAFEAYADVFSNDNVNIGVNFDGLKVTECLRKIAKMTDSSMFVIYTNSETKLSFNRYTNSSSEVLTLTTSEQVIDVQLEIDDRDMINNQIVNALYNVTDGEYDIVVNDQDSASVNSFGVREQIAKDENVWYTTSATAQNFAQRVTSIRATPYNKISVRTNLRPLASQVGEGLEFSDNLLGFGQAYRLKTRIVNMDDGRMDLTGDASAFFDGFTLDVDSLDSTDKFLL